MSRTGLALILLAQQDYLPEDEGRQEWEHAVGGAHRSRYPPVSVVCEPLLILKTPVMSFQSLNQNGLAGLFVEMHLAIFDGQVKNLVKLGEAFCQLFTKFSLRVLIHMCKHSKMDIVFLDVATKSVKANFLVIFCLGIGIQRLWGTSSGFIYAVYVRRGPSDI